MVLFMTLLSDEEKQFVEKLFKEHSRLFLGIAYRILVSKEEAEDAVSDAMIQIITNLDKISSLTRHEMRNYCIVIVKHCAVARFRKNKISVNLESVDQCIVSTDHAPDADVMRKERASDFRALIRRLPEEDRILVELRFFHNLPYRDISRILEISEETARKRIERILKKLRGQINEDLYYG